MAFRRVTKHGIYPELDLEETKNVLNVSASLMPLGPKLIEKKIVKFSSSSFYREREAEYRLWKKKKSHFSPNVVLQSVVYEVAALVVVGQDQSQQFHTMLHRFSRDFKSAQTTFRHLIDFLL